MASVAMNREELIAFVRQEFRISDIFQKDEIRDFVEMTYDINEVFDASDIYDYVRGDADPIEIFPDLDLVPEGYNEKIDLIYDLAWDTDHQVISDIDRDAIHDDLGHTGAARWCPEQPCCSGNATTNNWRVYR